MCVTLGFGKVNRVPGIHHEIRFRNFNNFDLNAFIADNDFNLFENILCISDPDSALHLWVQIFTSIFNKHAPNCTTLDSKITGLRVKLKSNKGIAIGFLS